MKEKTVDCLRYIWDVGPRTFCNSMDCNINLINIMFKPSGFLIGWQDSSVCPVCKYVKCLSRWSESSWLTSARLVVLSGCGWQWWWRWISDVTDDKRMKNLSYSSDGLALIIPLGVQARCFNNGSWAERLRIQDHENSTSFKLWPAKSARSTRVVKINMQISILRVKFTLQ